MSTRAGSGHPARSWGVVIGVVLAVLLMLGGVYAAVQVGGSGSETAGAGSTSEPDRPDVGTGGGEPGTGGEPGDGEEPGAGGKPGDGGGEPAYPGTSGAVEPEPSYPMPTPTVPATPNQIPVAAYKLVAPTTLTLRYYIGVPECYGTVDRVEVEESAAAVEVLLVATPPKDQGDVPCIDIALAKTTRVRLDAPLGNRTVIDAATGLPVPSGDPDPR